MTNGRKIHVQIAPKYCQNFGRIAHRTTVCVIMNRLAVIQCSVVTSHQSYCTTHIGAQVVVNGDIRDVGTFRHNYRNRFVHRANQPKHMETFVAHPKSYRDANERTN